jgi:hypothetical protein
MNRCPNMKPPFSAIVCAAVVGVLCATPSALAQQKTIKECRAAWQANKAENQAKRITETAYIAQCRAGTSSPAMPMPPATATSPVASPATTPRTSSVPPAPSPTGANQFASESQAKAHCPGDTVVWANLSSKIYHYSAHKDYGTTKRGAYMCERDTAASGVRAAKNEKHP